MTSALTTPPPPHSSTPSSEDSKHQHKRNVSTDSCDYERLPSTTKHRTSSRSISKSSVTEDARRVLDRFLKHLSPAEELLLRGYFKGSKHKFADAQDEHAYESYKDHNKLAQRSDNDDSNDIYQSFRHFRGHKDGNHHYYDIDQPSRKTKNAFDLKPRHAGTSTVDYVDCEPIQVKEEFTLKTFHARAEEYISRLCLGHFADSPCTSTSVEPPIAVAENYDDEQATSSSTEDYEFPDNELLNRKKKSTIRLAIERFQQSFKRQLKKGQLTATSPNLSVPTKRERQNKETNLSDVECLSLCSSSHKKCSSSRGFNKKSRVYDEQMKVNRNFFEGVIKQLRKGGLKLRRKTDREKRSRSADNLNTIIRPLKPEEKKLLERYRRVGYESDSNNRRQGRIYSTITRRPRMPLPLVEVEGFKDLVIQRKDLEGSDKLIWDDEVDGDVDRASSSSSNLPFHLKTEAEKDELFGKIADQLAAIADNYKQLGLITANSSSDCVKGVTLDKFVPKCGASQNAFASGSIAAELVDSTTYSKFEEIVAANVAGEAGWKQIAYVFRLTRSAIHLAGMGTSVASSIREFTMKYFEDKFAAWIADRGGWESMVEDVDENGGELNSEID